MLVDLGTTPTCETNGVSVSKNQVLPIANIEDVWIPHASVTNGLVSVPLPRVGYMAVNSPANYVPRTISINVRDITISSIGVVMYNSYTTYNDHSAWCVIEYTKK